MSVPIVLVAGIGNLFLGDDAFGVEVAQRLAERRLPDEVRVEDFGIRGLDLLFALLDGYRTAILVDAVPRGDAPGTLYVIEPEPDGEDVSPPEQPGLSIEMHNLDPWKVLRLAKSMGSPIEQLLLVGCEPAPLDSAEDMAMGLSPAVAAAVGEAVLLVESLVAKALQGSKVLGRT